MRTKRTGTPEQISMVEALSTNETSANMNGRDAQEKEINDRRKSKKAERQEFFLPVTGFVWFYPEEVEVINH
jgi:hypothetical protein